MLYQCLFSVMDAVSPLAKRTHNRGMIGRAFGAILVVIPCFAAASKADEAAIRKQLMVRAQSIVKGSSKQLSSVDQPDFHAITFDRKLITSAQIKQHLDWRFKNQISPKREERALSFKFLKDKAEVKITIFDEFTSKDARGQLIRSQRREHGISTWVKTSGGWKQSKLQYTKVEWVDEQGKWQTRP